MCGGQYRRWPALSRAKPTLRWASGHWGQRGCPTILTRAWTPDRGNHDPGSCWAVCWSFASRGRVAAALSGNKYELRGVFARSRGQPNIHSFSDRRTGRTALPIDSLDSDQPKIRSLPTMTIREQRGTADGPLRGHRRYGCGRPKQTGSSSRRSPCVVLDRWCTV